MNESNSENSIDMKLVVTVIMSWLMMPILVAQDSTATTCLPKKTLVIRKKQTLEPSLAPKDETIVVAPVEKKISILKTSTIDSLQGSTIDPQEKIVQLPTLAGGDFGLMNIKPYRAGMDLKNWKFVVLEYSVNQYGWVSQVEVLKSNDSRLKNVVLRKLKASKWNPARNQLGEPIKYKMYQQVVIVKDRTYEEDYRRNY